MTFYSSRLKSQVSLHIVLSIYCLKRVHIDFYRFKLKFFLVFLLVLALCWFVTEEIPITVSRRPRFPDDEAWSTCWMLLGLVWILLGLVWKLLGLVLVLVSLGAVLLPDTVKKIRALLSTMYILCRKSKNNQEPKSASRSEL